MYAECKWRLWTTQINILKTENVNRGSTGFGVLSLLYVYWLKIILSYLIFSFFFLFFSFFSFFFERSATSVRSILVSLRLGERHTERERERERDSENISTRMK